MRRAPIIVVWVLIVSAAVPLASSTSRAVVTHNKLATDKLATNLLSADRSAQDLLSTAGGRDAYGCVVSCALPADITIVATVGGIDFNSPGASASRRAGWTTSSTETGSAGSPPVCSPV